MASCSRTRQNWSPTRTDLVSFSPAQPASVLRARLDDADHRHVAGQLQPLQPVEVVAVPPHHEAASNLVTEVTSATPHRSRMRGGLRIRVLGRDRSHGRSGAVALP